MKASIIITTRNRAPFLKDTLQVLRHVVVPDGLQMELLVVDNGSTDSTAEVVRLAAGENTAIRHICERHAGQCHARNRGLAESSGEAILFVDDDVHVPTDWLAGMCQPFIDHGPCGVAGGVRLPPTHCRPWMSSLHRSWLASTERLDTIAPRGMVGANMGFSREILCRIPGFDTELGPGALGFGDEQLFASQLLEAGYRIIARPTVCVDHHFDPSRLKRDAWLDAALKRGRSHAYCGHHWEHWESRTLRPRLGEALVRLSFWKMLHRRDDVPDEGCSAQELQLRYRCELLRAHLRERERPRNYTHRGLVKRPTAAAARPVGAGDIAPCGVA